MACNSAPQLEIPGVDRRRVTMKRRYASITTTTHYTLRVRGRNALDSFFLESRVRVDSLSGSRIVRKKKPVVCAVIVMYDYIDTRVLQIPAIPVIAQAREHRKKLPVHVMNKPTSSSLD